MEISFFRKKVLKLFLWTRRMLFSKLCLEKFVKRPKFFGSLSKKDEKHNISIENSFPKFYPWTCIWNQFWQFRRNVFQNCMKFFDQCPELEKKESKLEKKPSKCSIGHVEGDFDNPPYKTSTKGENLPARFAKMRWNRFFLRNSIFLENIPNGHSECSFGRHPENFSTITEKFSIKFCLFRKKSFFWEKVSFLGMFLWTRSFKISQPRRNFSGRDRTTLQQRPKVIN